MGTLYLWNRSLLLVDGSVARHLRCCCPESSSTSSSTSSSSSVSTSSTSSSQSEPCPYCERRQTPERFRVTIAGIVDTVPIAICGPLCPTDITGCTNLNDNYVVRRSDDNPCFWNYHFPANGEICRMGQVRMGVERYATLPSRYRVDVHITMRVPAVGLQNISFRQDYGLERPNCIAFNGENIPFWYEDYTLAGCNCDAASGPATCRLTALP